MFRDEIKVPKELREFMMDGAEETFLGQKNGAKKQYRYGKLHIREYDDNFLVHTDRIDPRQDPLGHLLYDAPEVLVGLGCAFLGGLQIGKSPFNKNRSKKSTLSFGILSSVVTGYLGYTTAKKLKKYLE